MLVFSNMNELLITYTELGRRLSLSRVKIWEMIRDGEFPPPIRIGRAVRFVVSDVDGWIADHVSAQANGDSGRPTGA